MKTDYGNPAAAQRRSQPGTRRASWSACLAVCVVVLVNVSSRPAHAQSAAWRPDKAVEIIASSAPGGSTDKTSRTLQKIMQEGQLVPVPVNVVNKPGGNQTLARAYLNQQQGDAHYLDIGNPTLITNNILGVSTQHYSDFTPIALLLNEYTVFTVRADSPMRSIRDLIEGLKKDPDAVSIGVSNLGGTNHVTLSRAVKTAGVDPKRLKVVVFKSNADSLTALMGGHIKVVASTVTPVIGQMQAGKARIIAIGAPKRMGGALAEVPTLREAGIDVSQSNWRAMVGPRGINAAQITYWEEIASRMVKSDIWKKELEANFWEGHLLRGRPLRDFLAAESKEAKEILSELGLAK